MRNYAFFNFNLGNLVYATLPFTTFASGAGASGGERGRAGEAGGAAAGSPLWPCQATDISRESLEKQGFWKCNFPIS